MNLRSEQNRTVAKNIRLVRFFLCIFRVLSPCPNDRTKILNVFFGHFSRVGIPVREYLNFISGIPMLP